MRAAEVLRLVSGALQDLEPGLESRWPWEGGDDGRIGLLDFLNAALRAVALQRPDATVITEALRLEPGMRQRLPRRRIHEASRDATMLIELVRNMGRDGETPGPAIVSAQPSVLLAWADAGLTSRVVDNYAYDRMANKDVYYVYPGVPQDEDVWVEASYSAPPPVITSPEQDLGIADDYAVALEHYVLASVLAGDNESSNANKAAYHMRLYSAVLGVKMQIDGSWPKAKSSAVMGGGA